MAVSQALDLAWWITMVELPVFAGLFWLIWRVRADAETAIERIRQNADAARIRMREGLAAYKLEVAKGYVSIGYLKDVERRLTDHLIRIDARIEAAARSSNLPGAGGPR